MISSEHKNLFEKYKNYKPTEKEIQMLRKNFFSSFIPSMQKIISALNIKSEGKIESTIIEFMYEHFNNFTSSRYLDSFLYEHTGIETLLENPNIISKKLPFAKNFSDKHTLYTANFERTLNLVLSHAYHELQELEEAIKIFGVEQSAILSKEFRMKNPDLVEETEKYLKFLKQLQLQKTEKDKIIFVLKKQKEECEKQIKNNMKESLQTLYAFFSLFGFSDLYYEFYNSTKDKFGFAELNYDKYKNTKKSITTLPEPFTEEFLDKLSIRDLSLLTTFGYNRFAKECSSLSNCFCTMNSLDLWEKLFNGDTNFDISNENFIGVIKKNKFTTALARSSFELHQKNISSEEYKKGVDSNVELTKDFSSYYQKINNLIKEDYDNFFQSSFLTNNDFLQDIGSSFLFVNPEGYAYWKKDTCLFPIIQKSIQKPMYFKNWGIIRNEMGCKKIIDSITSDKNKVLLAFDIKGFNMPFRFHINKETLTDVIKSTNSTSIIPEYQGAEDFYSKDENIPTSFVLPILKEHKKIIIENSKKEGPSKKFWEHLYFLMNESRPSHFFETFKTPQGTTGKRKKPTVFTDLKTGERFIEEKGEFKKIDENIR